MLFVSLRQQRRGESLAEQMTKMDSERNQQRVDRIYFQFPNSPNS